MMCLYQGRAQDLCEMRRKIEIRKEDMAKNHKKIFIAMEPIIDDVLAWLDAARVHIDGLYHVTDKLEVKSNKPLSVKIVADD